MKKLLYKLLSKNQLLGVFISISLLMTVYEILKETYFQGRLTLWESHFITIFVTATFSTIAGCFIRKMANILLKETQEAHAKVQAIITNIFDAVIIINEQGVIESLNPAAEKIFGYSESDIIGKNVKLLMPEPFSSEHDRYIKNYLNSGIPKILGKNRREVPGLRVSGEVFMMDLITSEMRVDDHLKFIGIIRDITDYKKAEGEMNRLRQAESQLLKTIQSELTVAATVQMNMLPKCYYLFPQYPQVKAYGIMRAAKEIGGDFYDAFAVDSEHIAIAIGDVSGKGIPAALFMMETMALLRSKITKPRRFSKALHSINRLLCENNETNMFVTLFVGLLNVTNGELRYINGGHNPPLIAQKDSAFTILNVPSNPLLGVYDEANYDVAHIQLKEGDTLILYTDGVTEAENNQQDFFSLSRTIDTLNFISKGSDVRALVNNLCDEISNFCGNQTQSDDLTVFALRYSSNATAGFKRTFFEWSDDLSVDIQEIDEQHKMLIDLVNQLYDEVVVKKTDIETAEEILNDLVQYASIHIDSEEKLFKYYHHPEFESHRCYHSELIGQLTDVRRKVKENKSVLNIELLRFLRKWLDYHIAIEDKMFFKYLKNNNQE